MLCAAETPVIFVFYEEAPGKGSFLYYKAPMLMKAESGWRIYPAFPRLKGWDMAEKIFGLGGGDWRVCTKENLEAMIG